MRRSGPSFFLVLDTHLGTIVDAVVYIVIAAAILGVVRTLFRKIDMARSAKTVQEKSSKELLEDIASFLLPQPKSTFKPASKGWINSVDERLERLETGQKEMANKIDKIGKDTSP